MCLVNFRMTFHSKSLKAILINYIKYVNSQALQMKCQIKINKLNFKVDSRVEIYVLHQNQTPHVHSQQHTIWYAQEILILLNALNGSFSKQLTKKLEK